MSKVTEEPRILVSARVVNLPETVPGSGTTTCDECKQDVWVSPSGMRAIQQGFITIVMCTDCALPTITAESIVGFLPGAVRELRTVRKR